MHLLNQLLRACIQTILSLLLVDENIHWFSQSGLNFLKYWFNQSGLNFEGALPRLRRAAFVYPASQGWMTGALLQFHCGCLLFLQSYLYSRTDQFLHIFSWSQSSVGAYHQNSVGVKAQWVHVFFVFSRLRLTYGCVFSFQFESSLCSLIRTDYNLRFQWSEWVS